MIAPMKRNQLIYNENAIIYYMLFDQADGINCVYLWYELVINIRHILSYINLNFFIKSENA